MSQTCFTDNTESLHGFRHLTNSHRGVVLRPNLHVTHIQCRGRAWPKSSLARWQACCNERLWSALRDSKMQTLRMMKKDRQEELQRQADCQQQQQQQHELQQLASLGRRQCARRQAQRPSQRWGGGWAQTANHCKNSQACYHNT